MSDLVWFKSSYSDSGGGQCVEVAYDWHKSSYSDSSGGECVEVAYDWQKSSYSDSSGGQCVEVATTVHIRDSKNPDGPHLRIAATAWTDFLAFAAR
ncbi:DUF397 domain-containing protein [Streptomyces sp. RKCA744]|uniref:DUF397 domain-containing protein n=1 Tax=Streptomyces sp. RKCA744 TaxID=2959340 RepID=UPI00209FB312|nr:DUF397 domain-containing protein [Streptomyces sp. RKCA744]MCO8306516.1 DUF397 domain-containing protein [Streptomyces sp. RKCA744]